MTPRWRWIFAAYALALLIATHWPGLAIDGPIDRTDIIIHIIAFCAWTMLLALAVRARPRTLLIVAVIALAWAAVDEWTQRFVNRTSTLDDFLANATGVTLACLLYLPIARRHAKSHTAHHHTSSPSDPFP